MSDLFIPSEDGQYTYQDVVTLKEQLPNITYINLKDVYYNDLPVVLRQKNPNIENDVDDIWYFGDGRKKRFFIQQSVECKDMYELPGLKKEKINEIEKLYSNFQLVELLDSIVIYFPLKGSFYALLKDRVATAQQEGFCSIQIIDKNGDVFQARDDLICKRVPYIFINEIFCQINIISETNKLKKDNLIGNDDYNTIGVIQKTTSIKDLNEVNINVFNTCPQVDLDAIINNFFLKTDQEIQAMGYFQYDINNFRAWKNNLSVDSRRRYVIFQKR